MEVRIQDRGALNAVPPLALSASAHAVGWAKRETFRDHSDIYVHEHAPEIIIPRTQRLGDYAEVVSQLIEIFAEAAETDELSLYRDLITADRDVIRVKTAPKNACGSAALKDMVKLITGEYDMLLAAARSLHEPVQYCQERAIQEVDDLMQRVCLG